MRKAGLRFEWDGAKAASNLAKRGFSFDDAIAIWADPEMAVQDSIREEDGELRSKAIGMIEDRLFIAVYVARGGAIGLISARRANKSEEKSYGDY